jgi:hypothetical protein
MRLRARKVDGTSRRKKNNHHHTSMKKRIGWNGNEERKI